MRSLVGLALLTGKYFMAATCQSSDNDQMDRESTIRLFNPKRNASSKTTPLQVGNGDFAFGADVTGLQTFQPFNTMSSWGWHNDSLPTIPGQTSPSDYVGLQWWTHDRLVEYAQPNPAKAAISQWMIANPHRINLGRIGLYFDGENVTESSLTEKTQELDLYSGVITSQFKYKNEMVSVEVVADPDRSAIAARIKSTLLKSGKLGVFFDYPYASGRNKFDAPFVGVWNATEKHRTILQSLENNAIIQHNLDSTNYYTNIEWSNKARISGPLPSSHRYILTHAAESSTMEFTVTFSPEMPRNSTSSGYDDVEDASTAWWNDYWEEGAFIDLTNTEGTPSANATELQRRIILSQYLLAVNGAGRDPAQESGLTNNGWYGKFHAEMFHWHLGHWQRWGKWELFERAMPGVYNRFLATSIQRAKQQGYAGARWGKMSDPSGRSAPGEINSLLIWQQPHPFMFAEVEYREYPTKETLLKWDNILTNTADFMTSYAYYNATTGKYDLGPPMYPVSENTNPNTTRNPTFELAYWSFGLDIAAKWQQRLGRAVPAKWAKVAENLAPLPVQNNTYVIYEGITDMWTTPSYTEDHPSMLGIYGWLPPPSTMDQTTMANTVARVYETWNFPFSFGWDFPLLAMNAARMGDAKKAIEFLLHPAFQFDDAGYPVGGPRVPTPYFPGSSSLLLAVAMMAGGWEGVEGPVFPEEWSVAVEGFSPAL